MNNFFSNLLINTIGICILLWAVYKIYTSIRPGSSESRMNKQIRKAQEQARKQDNDRIGSRFTVPRVDKPGIPVNLYLHASDEPVPMIFLCHGGTLLDGDADQMDSFCARMKEQWEADIISINYAKLNEHKIPWQQDEITDTVLYFLKHASEYNADPDKAAFVGFSGGAYIQTGAAALLAQQGVRIKGMVQFYPLIDDSIINLTDAGLIPCPVSIVTASNPEMNKRCQLWYEHLEKAGVKAEQVQYPAAVQGFIEYCNPEFLDDPRYANNLKQFDEDQKDMARACEIRVTGILKDFFK